MVEVLREGFMALVAPSAVVVIVAAGLLVAPTGVVLVMAGHLLLAPAAVVRLVIMLAVTAKLRPAIIVVAGAGVGRALVFPPARALG
ncbi:MAG: hypothetical protein B7Y99_09005 [Caulobacterales bacterium 32-69-10]|nr:MAG: hypothetical protein B7Y99_09005 [Caulobacterales bacterium 32-69-10]